MLVCDGLSADTGMVDGEDREGERVAVNFIWCLYKDKYQYGTDNKCIRLIEVGRIDFMYM